MHINQDNQGKITRYGKLLFSVTAVLIGIIAWPARFYFLNDDLVHIPLAASYKLGHNNSVRYTGDLSLIIDYLFFGKWATGYHITNLILHLLNTGLFVCILREIFRGYNPWILIYAGLMFAWFGFHSDAIFWIIGRSATLGFLFTALALLCIIHVEKHAFYYIGLVLAWIMALFSYESVWVIPPLALFVYAMFRKKVHHPFFENPFFLVVLWILFIGYLFIRKWITGDWLGAYEGSAYQSLELGKLAMNYAKLISRTFIPPISQSVVFALIALIIILVYTFLVYKVYHTKLQTALWKIFHVGWLISYLPYLSLGISTKTIESERYLYLPSAFFSICIMYTLWLLLYENKRILFHSLSICMIIFHGYWLVKASGLYANAGNTVEKTFRLLKENQQVDHLKISTLPATISGIPTLRDGFVQGYNWLINPSIPMEITIIDTAFFKNANLTPVILKVNGGMTVEFKEN